MTKQTLIIQNLLNDYTETISKDEILYKAIKERLEQNIEQYLNDLEDSNAYILAQNTYKVLKAINKESEND
nr:MAG TPA: hypothetical protein [Caudoviricetes sp.]